MYLVRKYFLFSEDLIVHHKNYIYIYIWERVCNQHQGSQYRHWRLEANMSKSINMEERDVQNGKAPKTQIKEHSV